jgi:1-phosphofructokinase
MTTIPVTNPPAAVRPVAHSVAVFDPSPLLTVTVESSVRGDQEIHLHAGGQGFWVARMIARLGLPVTLCAPFGDDTGRVLRVLVEAEDVTVRGVTIQGFSGAYVHDRRDGERRVLAELDHPYLTRHEIDDLYGAALVTGLEADVTVLTGPARHDIVPADFYRRLAIDIRRNGGIVVADVDNSVLESTLDGGIDVLKISHEELIDAGYAESGEPDDALAAIDRLQAAGARNVLVSRAADPALVRIGERTVEIVVPRLEPLDFRGSGDSMTAGVATGLARGMPLDDALRLAAAAGALNVTRRGLGTGSAMDIDQMSHRIEIRPFTQPHRA